VLLGEQIELAIAHARREDRTLALLHLDLDEFKLVNDSLGHRAGDQLLAKVAARLTARKREEDVLTRPGGDEFVLIVCGLNPGDADSGALAAARGLVATMQTPFVLAGAEFHVGASVGVSILGRDAHDGETLLRHAEAAMYQAKAVGAEEIRVFSADRGEPLRRLAMTARLRHAIADEQLILHWQPIFDPRSEVLFGVEALVRWEDPVRGLVAPGEFVPFAEETGLIHLLGDHVVELLCRQRLEWREAGLEPRMTFNVSARQLRRNGFVTDLCRRLDRHGVDPAGLTVELTESTALADPELTEPMLHELAAAGLRIAIDDFGAGYSSLGRLKRLPVHMLKLDRSFLAGAPADPAAAAILTAVIDLSRALGMDAVAEGVEEEEQRKFLIELGCPLAQGFLLGRPVPAAHLTDLLAAPRVAAA
jgi:diguanylate cyclase (GGDEF)-like protein